MVKEWDQWKYGISDNKLSFSKHGDYSHCKKRRENEGKTLLQWGEEKEEKERDWDIDVRHSVWNTETTDIE